MLECLGSARPFLRVEVKQLCQQVEEEGMRLRVEAREALGGRRLQLAQLGVDVVEIDKKCAFHESSGVFGDCKVFRSLVLLPGSCLPAGSLSGMDGRPSRYWPGATPVHCLKAR